MKPKANVSEQKFADNLRGKNAFHRRTIRKTNVRVVNVTEETAEAVLAALKNDPDIEFAERDYIATASFVPNDQYVASGTEWHLAKIQATDAWNFTAGQSNIIVAVIDSGANNENPDLVGKLVAGYNFTMNDTNTTDDFGHGTAVAGTIAAAGNNGLGVAGVAFNCSVMPVKVMGNTGIALHSTIAQGIEYAVDHGARVINLSLGGDSSSSTLQSAINYAWEHNVVVIAAAGNNNNTNTQYPAACDHVVGVVATDSNDSRASFSSYGDYVKLSAPGDGIWTTQRTPGAWFGAWRGTSFASPVTAGVAALIVSANPSLSNEQVVNILEQSADDLGSPGFDTTYGFGRVNALRAVNMARGESGATMTVNLTSPASSTEFTLGSTVNLSATVSAAGDATITGVEFFANDSSVGTSTSSPFTAQWTPSEAGDYSITAIARDNHGATTTSSAVTIHVSAPVVVTDTNAPSVVVAPPAANYTSPLLLTGTASDDRGVDRVKIQVNGSGDFITAEGTVNWNAQINLIPGNNLIRVWSVDTSGNVSLVDEVTLNYTATSQLTVTTNGFGKVSPNLNGQALQVGNTYTVKAVPGAGQVFAGWEGIDSDSAVLTFVMQPDLKLTAKFIPTPFPPVMGKYAGLVADTNGVAPESSGSFNIKVGKLGAFSGKLYVNGKRHGFSGKFNATGVTAVSVYRGTNTPCAVNLNLDLTSGTDMVTGNVTDGSWKSDLNGDRNVFNSQLNPASQAGIRQFILERASTQSQAANGLSKIGTTGNAKVNGLLEDGRKFANSSSLAKNGDCPLYLSLSGGSEVIIGWLNFPANGGAVANGDVVWVKTGTNSFSAKLQAAAVK